MEFILERVPEPERAASARPPCRLMTVTHPLEPCRPQDGEFDSTRSPNIQHLLPSGIGVLGIDVWMQKLADVA